MSQSVVTCGAKRARCRCVLPAEHEKESTPHECSSACGGSWRYDAAGKFIVVTYPSGVSIPALRHRD